VRLRIHFWTTAPKDISRNFPFGLPIPAQYTPVASCRALGVEFFLPAAPADPERNSFLPCRLSPKLDSPAFLRDSTDTSPALTPSSIDFLTSAVRRLPCWRRQLRDPPHRRSEQAPCQTALRQEQPIIAGIPQSGTCRPPVFTSLCGKLVKDQPSIPLGSTSRRPASRDSPGYTQSH
jgi:hypothetical protein